MINQVIKFPNKKLRIKSQEVKLPLSKEDKQIAKNLIFYLNLSKKENNNLQPGIGLAAVQLGFLKRMFLVDFIDEHNQNNYELLINPKIISESQTFASLADGEGCLSVNENHNHQEGYVHRKNKIILKAFSYFQNKEIEIIKVGFGAIVYQHEIDHLNGKLFFDRIDKKDIWKPKNNEIII